MSHGAQVTSHPYLPQLPALVPINPQKISFTGTSSQSNAFAPNCTCIRVFPTEDCYIKIGVDPTATTSDIFLPGGIIQFLAMDPLSNNKIAIIQSTTSGTFHLFEGK